VSDRGRRFAHAILVVAGTILFGLVGDLAELPWVMVLPAAALLAWKPARAALASHELAALALAVLAAATAGLTFFPGTASFGSLAFMSLLGLVGLSSIVCVRERNPIRARLSHLLIHVSVLVVLVGAAGRTDRVEGYLELEQGKPKHTASVLRDGKPTGEALALPFDVRLDRFEVEFHEPRQVVYVYAGMGEEASESVDVGQREEVRVLGRRIVGEGASTETFRPRPGHPPVEALVAHLDVDGRKVHFVEGVPTRFDGLIYRFVVKREPREYRSTLAVLDSGGGEAAAKTVVVNDPLIHEGWWLYQSNWDPERTTVSGIRAVRDPWLPVVFAGLAMACLGLLLKLVERRRTQTACQHDSV
jgi:hypothetical protein